MRNKKLRFAAIVSILGFFFIWLSVNISSVPSQHTVAGLVFLSDGSNAPLDTPVFINLTETNNTYKTTTYGPPFSPNNYAYEVMGEDFELVIVHAWNDTHYGTNTTALGEEFSTNYSNIVINTTRDPEANVTIIYPANNSEHNAPSVPLEQVFNVTANVTILGHDGKDCNATISFSDPSIIGLSSGENYKNQLGDIGRLSTSTTVWQIKALAEGASDITVTSYCRNTSMSLEKSDSYKISAEVKVPPMVSLEYPANNSKYYNQQDFTFNYNVTSDIAVDNCSLIIGGQLNKTNDTITLEKSQNFTLYDIGSGNYNWSVNCTDSEGFEGHSARYNISFSDTADLTIDAESIIFSNSSPLEDENITVTANVSNIGEEDAANAVVRFFRGNYTDGNQIGSDREINVTKNSYNLTNITMLAPLGVTEIFVVLDPPIDTGGLIAEGNESNNLAYSILDVPTRNIIVGNFSGELALNAIDGSTLISWQLSNTTGSNIYVADSDSSVSFNSLRALTRDINGNYASDDFEELDKILGMENLTESLNDTYTRQGNPINTTNLTVFDNIAAHVPIINSTNSSKFITGILWDSSDDDIDGEFDEFDKEDIVFVGRVLSKTQGRYGKYDFEMEVPAYFRNYKQGQEAVSIYGEII